MKASDTGVEIRVQRIEGTEDFAILVPDEQVDCVLALLKPNEHHPPESVGVASQIKLRSGESDPAEIQRRLDEQP